MGMGHVGRTVVVVGGGVGKKGDSGEGTDRGRVGSGGGGIGRTGCIVVAGGVRERIVYGVEEGVLRGGVGCPLLYVLVVAGGRNSPIFT